MKDWQFFCSVVAVFGIISVMIIFQPSQSASIPPTPAFSKVIINGDVITADQYNEELNITTEGDIVTDIDGNNIIIKLAPISCPILQAITDIDSNGFFVCGIV